MKAFLKNLALILVLFAFSVGLLKGCQKICWDTKWASDKMLRQAKMLAGKV